MRNTPRITEQLEKRQKILLTADPYMSSKFIADDFPNSFFVVVVVVRLSTYVFQLLPSSQFIIQMNGMR